jgi:hypothetical protein
VATNFYVELGISSAWGRWYFTFTVGVVDHPHGKPQHALLNSLEHIDVGEIFVTNGFLAHQSIMAYREMS